MEQGKTTVAKALASLLTGIAGLGAYVGLDGVVAWLTPEVVMAVSTAVGTLLVYLWPNKKLDPNQ